MNKVKMLLWGFAAFSMIGVVLAFTPKKSTQLCLYIKNAGGGCPHLGKFDTGGGTIVTGKVLSPNPNGVCPPPPTICEDEVDIQPQE